MQQIEIANEWDKIEYTLQNDEFWLFIQNDLTFKTITRIDFILDLIRQQEIFGNNGDCGNDEHQTFRYFYNYFNSNKKYINAEWLRKTWLSIKNYFQIFEEWYNDFELYHYVGFLVDSGETIEKLILDFSGDKTKFKESIKQKIYTKIASCNNLLQEYEKGKSKTACYPLLLLYNIQTIIAQNKQLEESKYGMAIFYKFPFHLMKKESWDMEHIDSNTTNPLTIFSEQKEWLNDCLNEITDENLKQEITQFLQESEQPENFDDLVSKIDQHLNIGFERLHEPQNEEEINQKNLIWNYCLLDSGTNRSYGNAIFPAKRRRIIQKDKGENGVSFVPPCTKNVFLKYYNQQTNVLRAWEIQDAKAYLLDINKVLSGAGFIQDQRAEIDNL